MAEKEYIEREYVLKCMEDSYKNAGISAEAKAKVMRWLKKAPAADVRPVVRGEWRTNVPPRDLRPRCSVCGELQPQKTNYCPNCGADMRGEIVEDTTSGCGRCDKCRINDTGTCRYGEENT